ncbi:hypothetical protein PPV-Vac110-fpv036, partial [Avipoxvirus sp.]
MKMKYNKYYTYIYSMN